MAPLILSFSLPFCLYTSRVNCPFFFKMGACRHGDKCSRIHSRPTISQTLLLSHMYLNPIAGLSPEEAALVNPSILQASFENFYEDVYNELTKFGEVEDLVVCENHGDHLAGNVYVKYRQEEAACKALGAINGRFYAGRPVVAEFSPVIDFREAICRQFEIGQCSRGAFCGFLHLKRSSRYFQHELFGSTQHHFQPEDRCRSRSPSRSNSLDTDSDSDVEMARETERSLSLSERGQQDHDI
ncbi:splicing factor U2af subunit [Pelomyxa schiedti]|nr:splicing factor U2af subunit [Pelomyxa schiedti]